MLLDRERAQPGYSLYCNHNEGRAELIDLEGRAVHAWHAPDTRHWASCKLLPNGDLLVVGTDLDTSQPKKKVDAQRYLLLLSWRHLSGFRRTVTTGGLGFLILAVGISRVWLGVHWPLDCIGGYLLGGLMVGAMQRRSGDTL